MQCRTSPRSRHLGISPLRMTMATQRDYYEVLGVERIRLERRDRRRLSQAGREVSSGQEPGRRGGDRAVQGSGRGVRGAQRRGQAVALRPLRPRRRERPAARHHFTDVEDIFSAFGDILRRPVRRPRGGNRPRKGRDVRCDVTLTLKEAANGVTKTVEFQRHERCDDVQRHRRGRRAAGAKCAATAAGKAA